MDTGTHLVFGLSLGGLAMVDPVFSSHPNGATAVLLATVAGSNAPDLDMLIRLRGNANYIKHHRGLSHSLPAVLVWTALITGVVSLSYRSIPWPHFAFWVFLSVALHVLTDLFNTYGAQAYRPFSRRWIKWSIIHIFDPFIFFAQLLAILWWGAELADPEAIFPALYAILAAYYGWRTIARRSLLKKIPRLDPQRKTGDRYTVFPTMYPYRWNLVKQTRDGEFGIGEWTGRQVVWRDTLRCDDHPAADASRSHPDVAAFLEITPFPCVSVFRHSWGYEVRWMDIRYRYRRQYPFVAVVMMNFSFSPLQSFVGWLSEERLEKRLRMTSY